MQEFDHIQSLWQSHTIEVKISSDEMLAQVKKEVFNIRRKSTLNLVGMILSFLAIAALWVFFDFKSWTTHIGITLMITAIAVSTYKLYRSHRLISDHDFTVHPEKFLQNLKAYQYSRFGLYHTIYWFYALALSAGTMLYFYGALQSLNILLQILILLFSILWILLCATMVRKAYLKREKEGLDTLINKFERISAQFKEQN
ncbi:hypothetical protein LPB86_20615 [Pedobacter sp. MC2016-14]|uniref:hypothetical protein n=1 Tax=Pedobacter sp. MC2016-14 TaxID=2897327 RepID=UPI001E4B681F|nr:hypothetical protein [Pedobacter sp. MC2016-14]MCD0490653.1 hypothetical protein [Pedobacter sp. MC2016-14]